MKPRHAIILAIVIYPAVAHAAPSKLLDALRYEESKNRNHVINYNRNGTRDLGPYQLNERYLDDFRWRYNDGIQFDPFDYKQSRFIANAHLDAMRRSALSRDNDCGVAVKLSSWENIVCAWNCGMTRMLRGAPQSSKDFAKRVLVRAGYATK